MLTSFLVFADLSYRHMGVIGAVMVIRQLAESSSAFDMNRTVVSQHSTTGLSPARKKKVRWSFICNVIKSTMVIIFIFFNSQSIFVKKEYIIAQNDHFAIIILLCCFIFI